MLLPYVVISMCARVDMYFFLLLCVFNVHSVYVYIYLYIQYILHCAFCTDARDQTLARTPKRANAPPKEYIFFFLTALRTARERALDRAFLEFGKSAFVESHTVTFSPYIPPVASKFFSTPRCTRIRGRKKRVNDQRQHTCICVISSSKFFNSD